MPRELMEAAVVAAPAIAPVASPSEAAAVSFRSLLRMVMMPNLEAKVILAWVVWLFLRQLQSILGPRRRRSRHWLVQYCAMAAYYLPTLIAFYTANAVYSSSSGIKVVLCVGCSRLLISCARGAVTMTAFTLDQHGPARIQSWRLLPWLLYFAWLQWGSIWLDRRLTVSDVLYFTVVFIVPMLYVLLAKPRSPILDHETRGFACYMERVSRTPSPSPFFHGGDADSLYGACRYPFMQLSNGRWIDFSDVLKVRAVDPDICLSYIFCRLLARRYFGFPCAEDGDAQVRDFVVTELLADCDRAFAIVEVQLALLHDYFFTNYHYKIAFGLVSFIQGMKVYFFVSLIFLGVYFSAFLIPGDRESHIVYLCASAVPALLVFIVIRQPDFPVLPKHWHPIRNLFVNYDADMAASPSSVTDLSAAPRSRQSSKPSSTYWRRKMGQYSLIEDYDRRSTKKAIVAWCKVHVLSQTSYSFIQHHPAQEQDVSVPDSIRRFVARTIRDLNGPPAAMGAWSLSRRAQLDDLSWTCRQETLTHTILIWHIATSYCDMADMSSSSSQQPQQEEAPHQPLSWWLEDMWSQALEETSTGSHREVATTLSRYCAYLVAFLPELLPEHSLTAKVVLQQVLQEPRHLLGTSSGKMSMEAKRTRIQQLELPKDDPSSLTTTFEKGVWLGRQLDEQLQDVSLRWRAMADFWAETILYVAASSSSSDKAVAAHIELLAQGGEFVTHIWALLCNAGIVNLKRAMEDWTSHQGTA